VPGNHSPDGDHLRGVLRFAPPPVRPLVSATLFMVMDAAASLLTPLIVGLIAAHILGQSTIGEELPLPHLLLIWATLVIGQAGLRYLSTQRLSGAAAKVGAQLRLRSYEHIQALPAGFFDSREHGDILSLLSEDIRRISFFLTQSATQVVPHLITVTGAIFIVINTDPWTGLAALAVMPLVLWIIRVAGRAASPVSLALAEQHAAHSALTEENLRLHQLIKAYTREHLELQRYQSSNEALLNSELEHQQISNRVTPMSQAVGGLCLVALVWVGALRIETGALQAAELVSLMMYGFILFRPLYALGSTYTTYQSARGAAARLNLLLSEAKEPESGDGVAFAAPRVGIRIEDICFSYGRDRPVLQHFSAFVPAGTVCALEGDNGTGKTTLVHLIMRFMEPGSGRIRFDDTDIRDFELSALRSHIGYVPQHVTLVNGSIEENIRYGMTTASRQAVKKAADRALVSDFSANLPNGLQTQVGPRGVKLSGGQKQRIALARALLKNAPILILDEPTAMFDTDSEDELLGQLNDMLRDRTVLIITHRSALRDLAGHSIKLASKAVKPNRKS